MIQGLSQLLPVRTLLRAVTSLASRRSLSRSAARSRLLSVTSLRILEAPTMDPLALLSGEMAIETSRVVLL